MDKWADYLISEASYDHDHLIYVALRHQDTDKGITKGKPIDRLTISSDIKNGLVYITIFSGKDSWKKGHKIQTFSIGGNPYLRIDENKVKLDYLGDLPDTSVAKPEPLKELEFQPEPTSESISEPEDESTSEQLVQLEQLEKQIQEFESQQSITESALNSRGSLPKGFTKALPQEPASESEDTLSSQVLPESVKDTLPREIGQAQRDKGKSKQQLLEEYENEYLQRIEQDKIAQEKDHQEALEAEVAKRSLQTHGSLPKGFEPTPEPVTELSKSSRGSLPKGFTKTLPQEPILELEEEATPEQLAQLDDLQQQIDELEDMLSSQVLPESQPEEEEEATPEQLAQLDDLQQQIDELEDMLSAQLNPSSDKPTPEQLSRVKKLEKQIKKLESIDIEHKIIQTLQKQNDKLDNIEKKLHGTTTKKDISESDFPQAYCVKCKTKRKIKNSKETTMKNGRAAIKGFCPICNCKVFRIGKIKNNKIFRFSESHLS